MISIMLAIVVGFAGKLTIAAGGPWPVVALGVGGAALLVLGGSLRGRAIRQLRELPLGDRRRAFAYIRGEVQLRDELDIPD